jgi:hypothetical protein
MPAGADKLERASYHLSALFRLYSTLWIIHYPKSDGQADLRIGHFPERDTSRSMSARETTVAAEIVE